MIVGLDHRPTKGGRFVNPPESNHGTFGVQDARRHAVFSWTSRPEDTGGARRRCTVAREHTLKKKVRKKARAEVRGGEATVLVALCRACQPKRSRGLVAWLSERLPEGVALQQYGCFGACPKHDVAVAVGGHRKADWRTCRVFDPVDDRKKLLRRIHKVLRRYTS